MKNMIVALAMVLGLTTAANAQVIVSQGVGRQFLVANQVVAVPQQVVVGRQFVAVNQAAVVNRRVQVNQPAQVVVNQRRGGLFNGRSRVVVQNGLAGVRVVAR